VSSIATSICTSLQVLVSNDTTRTAGQLNQYLALSQTWCRLVWPDLEERHGGLSRRVPPKGFHNWFFGRVFRADALFSLRRFPLSFNTCEGIWPRPCLGVVVPLRDMSNEKLVSN
jgi:hypothetical protein